MFLDLHPLVIHFPIALLSSAVLFDFIAVVFKKDELLITSWWVMLLGLFSSTFSIITGLIDDSLIGHLFTTFPLWENHGLMQIISILIFCSIFIEFCYEKAMTKFISNLKNIIGLKNLITMEMN